MVYFVFKNSFFMQRFFHVVQRRTQVRRAADRATTTIQRSTAGSVPSQAVRATSNFHERCTSASGNDGHPATALVADAAEHCLPPQYRDLLHHPCPTWRRDPLRRRATKRDSGQGVRPRRQSTVKSGPPQRYSSAGSKRDARGKPQGSLGRATFSAS